MMRPLAIVLFFTLVSSDGCKCDCCTVEALSASQTQCGVSRSENCGEQCEVDGTANVFNATIVDYARYCYTDCRPTSKAMNAMCVAVERKAPAPKDTDWIDDDDKPIEVVTPKLAIKKAPAKAPKESGRALNTKSRQPRSASALDLQLAKTAYLEAKVHAKAAGEAARRAKESYEIARRSAREMSEQAGKMVLDEIKREAAEQAKKALDIRMDYENNARKNGLAVAVATAKPYKDAMNVANTDAQMWLLRANEFAASSKQLQGEAASLGAAAKKYTETQDWADAEAYNRQAHQAVEQSQEMAKRAEDTHAQAEAIQQTLTWYNVAGRAAAAKMMAASMPHDVLPPPLPPTVFLQKQPQEKGRVVLRK